MEFINNTGHIFSLPSFNEKPIGYEYEEYSYIFWIDTENSRLSVNNYYSKPIYALYQLQQINNHLNLRYLYKYLSLIHYFKISFKTVTPPIPESNIPIFLLSIFSPHKIRIFSVLNLFWYNFMFKLRKRFFGPFSSLFYF